MDCDYLVCGGGLAGCVIASRLREYLPDSVITLVEAGPDEHDNDSLIWPYKTEELRWSQFEYSYKTTPQKNYGGKEVYNAGGRALSGSTAVNHAAWTRGDAADFDVWGDLVNDRRWKYEGQLPYFKRLETYHDHNADNSVHGFEGPIRTASSAKRNYPLREHIRNAFLGAGHSWNPDANGGNPIGVSDFTENWYDGVRQFAGKAYPLNGVNVLTNSTIQKVKLDTGSDGKVKATGVELVDGRVINASKEVILCCGALRTPQLLLLSGIGPAEELRQHQIEQVVESPEVGRNFHDHSAITQPFKVRRPEDGMAGPALFSNPEFLKGTPADTIITGTVDLESVKQAIKVDKEDPTNHPLLEMQHSHYELLVLYVGAENPLTDLSVPLDGSAITVGILNLVPTARGTVSLASNKAEDFPIIDPNYLGTQTDKAIMRGAVRACLKAMETDAARAVISGDLPPAGYPELTTKSSDDEIDARIARCGTSWYHPAGTASMGKVVDSNLCVKGVDRLRVADASVMPSPIAAHIQCAMYALAEQAAEIVAGKA